MKILNSTTRDTEFSFQTTPISDLIESSELPDGSYIHIAKFIRTGSYTSEKILVETLKQKIYESVNNTFKTKYLDTHSHNTDDDYDKTIFDYLARKGWSESIPQDPDAFVKHVNYDFKLIKRYILNRNEDIENEISDINKELINLNCYFHQKMIITTTKLSRTGTTEITHDSVSHDKTVDDDYCQMSIGTGERVSNVWETPATGNLVVYGWLDSTDALNVKGISNAFCVLEAEIETENNKKWEIIGVQPVIPAKHITYVGFNVLVRKGLRIRVRTGFSVGVKSGQFSNEQDGNNTLSNSTPNGFKCQIFSNKDYDADNDNYS